MRYMIRRCRLNSADCCEQSSRHSDVMEAGDFLIGPVIINFEEKVYKVDCIG
jgi:hypothetical protein